MLDPRTEAFRRESFAVRYSRFIRACPQAEDSVARELAEAAFIEGRPSFVGRTSYHSQKRCNAINRANVHSDLRSAFEEEYGEPLREGHLMYVAPLNLPAIRALDEAYASLGRRISLPALWARSQGEF